MGKSTGEPDPGQQHLLPSVNTAYLALHQDFLQFHSAQTKTKLG